MDEVVSRSTSRERFNMWLMTVFGASALLLAAIGIYGLMAYSVEQRTQEIGIRLALGARASQVKNMVVRQGMSLALDRGRGRSGGVVRSERDLISTLLFGVTALRSDGLHGVPVVLTVVAFSPCGCRLAAPAASIRSSRCATSEKKGRRTKEEGRRRGREWMT